MTFGFINENSHRCFLTRLFFTLYWATVHLSLQIAPQMIVEWSEIRWPWVHHCLIHLYVIQMNARNLPNSPLRFVSYWRGKNRVFLRFFCSDRKSNKFVPILITSKMVVFWIRNWNDPAAFTKFDTSKINNGICFSQISISVSPLEFSETVLFFICIQFPFAVSPCLVCANLKATENCSNSIPLTIKLLYVPDFSIN